MLEHVQLHELAAEVDGVAYHFSRSEKARDSILTEGLSPRETDRYWCDELAPRPGHVYLCCGVGVGLVADQSFGGLWGPRARTNAHRAVAIDMQALDPSHINPDEDCCYESTLTLQLGKPFLSAPGASAPEMTVADPQFVEELGGPPLDAQPYASYGDWAQAHDIGSVAAHTFACVRGSVAYNGQIAAAALRPVDESELRELWQLYVSVRSIADEAA